MGKGRELTVAEKQVIIRLHERGTGPKKISDITKFNENTVKTIIGKWKRTGAVTNMPRIGRPRITTDRVDRKIVKTAILNRGISKRNLTLQTNNECETHISISTVRRRLHENNLKGRRARRKPWLSKKNIARRLKWAKLHSGWTSVEWSKVLWSDESKFCLFPNKGVKYVWRKPGEETRKECLVPTVKHGGGKSMLLIWRCTSSHDGCCPVRIRDDLGFNGGRRRWQLCPHPHDHDQRGLSPNFGQKPSTIGY